MFDRRMTVRVLVGVLVAGCWAALLPAANEKPDRRGGTIIGIVTAKGQNFLEVKAEGEEKARRYVPHWVGGAPKDGGGLDKKMLAEIARVKVGSRVKLRWEFEERPRVVKVEVLKAPEDKDEPRKGTVAGTLTAKDKNWIEVKADGEEKARRYFYYRGGTKELRQVVEDALVGSRVRIEWLFSERPRVLKLDVVKAPAKDR